MINDLVLESLNKDPKRDELYIKAEGRMRLAYSEDLGELILFTTNKGNQYALKLEDIKSVYSIDNGILFEIDDGAYFSVKSKRGWNERLEALKYLLAPLAGSYRPSYNT